MFGGINPNYEGGSSPSEKPTEKQTYCSRCQRWYATGPPHICPADVKVEEARHLLERFLGDDHKIHQ